jgi:ornithine cyclodeaminase
MKILVINQTEVRKLLPMRECMDVMINALKILAQGKAVNPLRPVMRLQNGKGLLGLMPAALEEINAMGIKIVAIFPGNQGTHFDSHPGGVLLFDTEHGQLLSLMDASEITAIRTAAVSGVATNLLAREDADSLAILGSGVQARTHLEAMLAARKIKKIRIWSRSIDNAKSFATRAKELFGVDVEVADSAQEAVDGAAIICTTTSSKSPVLMGDWLKEGVHINAAGSSISSTRELDTSAVKKSRLFVDRRESTLNEAGDFLIPRNEGAITDAHIQGEIGEILLGQNAGRTSAKEITLFKSLGLGVEDVASAHHIYHKARQQKLGTWVELGGERH